MFGRPGADIKPRHRKTIYNKKAKNKKGLLIKQITKPMNNKCTNEAISNQKKKKNSVCFDGIKEDIGDIGLLT